MAKRQTQQDFLPTRRVTPQQQIFDQYNAPKQFQAPRSELIEIGQALAGLSPTLKKFEEKEKAEDAAAMEIAVSKMSVEELRAASKRDFIGLQKKGVIPEGASPWAKVALLESAGRRLATQTVLPELYKNLDRLSDPNSTETPEEFARAIANEQGIDSLYASAAFEDALQPIVNQFTNRVGEAKAKRIAVQNRENLQDDLYEISKTFKIGSPDDEAAIIAKLQERLDTTYKDLGISGRAEAWEAISSAAKDKARNGNLEGALELLDSAGSLKIGSQTFGEDYASDIDELQEDLERLADAEEDREWTRTQRRNATNTAAAKKVAGDLFVAHVEDGSEFRDPTSRVSEIQEALREANVAEEDVNSITASVLKEYKTLQGTGEEDDQATVAQIRAMVSGTASLSEIETEIDSALQMGLLSGEMSVNLRTYARERKDIVKKTKTVESLDDGVNTARSLLIATMKDDDLEGGYYESDEITSIMDDYNTQYNSLVREIVEDPANKELDDAELSALVVKERRKLDKQFFDIIEGRSTEEVPEEASDILKASEEARRARQVELSTMSPELIAQNTWWDSDFTNANLRYQEIALDTTKSKEEKLKAQQRLAKELYELAQLRVEEKPEYKKEGIIKRVLLGDPVASMARSLNAYGEDVAIYIRAKSITGLSLEEINDREIHGREIEDELLNPKYVVLVDGIESAKDFEDYIKTDAGQTHLNTVYDSLPEQYKVGGAEFIRLQRLLFERYR